MNTVLVRVDPNPSAPYTRGVGVAHVSSEVLNNLREVIGPGAHIRTQGLPKFHVPVKDFGKLGSGLASVVSGCESHLKVVKISHSARDGQVH